MSYRAFKRLMGETSLERKCRFLFGGGLMLLITGSFYFYAQLNRKMVYDQYLTTARMLVTPTLVEYHWKKGIENDEAKVKKEDLSESIPNIQGLLNKAKLFPWDEDEPSKQFDDLIDRKASETLQAGRDEVFHKITEDGEYRYYTKIVAKESCLKCHRTNSPNLKEGDFMAMAKITLPLEAIEKPLNKMDAYLLTTAFVTACLAMIAAYAIVRYVIVKPILHLKDVSDGIARGTLDLRADIRTGDEFEELSHAFNRMLRHLVTVQDELKGVNDDLDGKIEELAHVNLNLYEMNKLKDEFLATMSHELRTPLNSILGFSDILANAQNLNERQKRFVENIQSSGQDLMSRINDILDLAKIEAGKMGLQLSEFSIEEFVARHVGEMMPLAQKKNIDLSHQVDPQLHTVYQDSKKVRQIIFNLLSNAIKFTPEGGRVRVSVRTNQKQADLLDIVVADTGIGIPLEEQDSIFEKFRQGKLMPGQKDHMKREFEGTGLGLSIIKELAHLLGGDVKLESEFGRGSTFTVKLPIRFLEQPEVTLPPRTKPESLKPVIVIPSSPAEELS